MVIFGLSLVSSDFWEAGILTHLQRNKDFDHMNNEANAIWNNFDKELHQFICNKVNHNDECHDILQNVYLKVLNNIGRIQQVNNIITVHLKQAE
jgi:DNA-directed RNA polymerase specialized sigma24 family protein